MLRRIYDEIWGDGISFNKVLFSVAGFFILVLIAAGISFSKQKEYFTPTQPNGEPYYDENGEVITVTMPDPDEVARTEVNGEILTGAFGETYTDSYYANEYIAVPVTDENHNLVTQPDGSLETTRFVVSWFYDPRA